MRSKRACIMDIDGTLLESFKEIYEDIIQMLFGKNKMVMRLNKLFYKINDFDVISNTMFIFKAVMLLYSLISFTSYSENIKIYRREYVKRAKDDILKEYNNTILFLEKQGFDIYLVSHNIYTNDFKKFIPTRIFTPHNKLVYIPKKFSSYNIIYTIGNNFFDDIVSAFMLNHMYKKEKSSKKSVPIYIGNSPFFKLLKNKVLNFKNLKEMREYIKKST